MGNGITITTTDAVKPKELNVIIDENYNKLQEHLNIGYAKLYKIRELYFGETEKQPVEELLTYTKVDMLVAMFDDMHRFINDTEEFLNLL